ncbi:MAG: protein kinase [Polyangiaceae bacterium]
MAKDLFGIVGTAIAGTYEVEAVVAEGGFAVVYRAHHAGFGAKVALKCLKLSRKLTPEREAEFLAQFKAEAALLFQLSSSIPTVVRPLHIDAMNTKDGTFVPYMVLEWLEGETLAAIIHHRAADRLPPPPLKKLVRLLRPVAQALARAHDFKAADGTPVSIVHQDIKPENIFVANVAGEQVVKILDFGVAKAQSVASQVAGSAEERSGVHSFTPAYAAPEQWAPEKFGGTGPWTDVWGFALTLVEAMAGRPIIDGDVATMMGLTLDPVARPTPLNNGVDVPEEVDLVFERALALSPKDRPANVGQFWDELLVALGMKEGHRDARREVGAVLREERVEVPRARGSGKPVRNAIGRVQLKPAAVPRVPYVPPKHRRTIDDPFELDDPPSPLGGVEALPPVSPPRGPPPTPKASLEFALPPLPENAKIAEPPRKGSEAETSFASVMPGAPSVPPVLGPPSAELEAAIPSVPPPRAPSHMEAAIPSVPPARRADSLEFSLPGPAARAKSVPAPPPFGGEVDLPGEPGDSLEAPLRSAPQSPPSVRGNIELGDDALVPTAKLRSDLPPRMVQLPRAAPARAPMRTGADVIEAAPPKRRVGRLGAGFGLVVGAIAVGLADRALRNEDGTAAFSLGPVSLTVLAGILFAAGVGLLIFELLPHDR